MTLPNDPFILLSFVNTKLRDECENLDDFCGRYDADKDSLTKKLGSLSYRYDSDINQFV